MGLQDIEILSTNRLEIDIMDIPTNCVVVISDGKAKVRELPPFGGV